MKNNRIVISIAILLVVVCLCLTTAAVVSGGIYFLGGDRLTGFFATATPTARPVTATTTQITARAIICDDTKRARANDSATISIPVRIRKTSPPAGTDLTTSSLTYLAILRASSRDRRTRAAFARGHWSHDTYTAGRGGSVAPSLRGSLTTPTIRNDFGKSPRPLCSDPPIGLVAGKYRFTSVSFTTATGSPPGVSRESNQRPLTVSILATAK